MSKTKSKKLKKSKVYDEKAIKSEKTQETFQFEITKEIKDEDGGCFVISGIVKESCKSESCFVLEENLEETATLSKSDISFDIDNPTSVSEVTIISRNFYLFMYLEYFF